MDTEIPETGSAAQVANFQAALAEQRKRKAAAEAAALAIQEAGPAVWPDSRGKGYDRALCMHIEGESHRKRVLAARGLQHAR